MNKLSRRISFFFIIGLYFLPLFSFCQTLSRDFGFERSVAVDVQNSALHCLLFPWSGGLNSIKISEIDLNFDGFKDLFIFEKNGNRILPFLNQGINDSCCFSFAPQYVHCFPKLHDWAILKDYNLDGKEDIFTYGLAGISLYKNISLNEPAFELVTEQLQSYYYSGYTNIYSSPDDYLAIDDVDGDGDLDILNFWLLGKYVHFQKNYGINPENPDFRLEDECWGHFSEGADNNVITLFTDCSNKNSVDEADRHVGSSLLYYDFTSDGVKDLILGDIDFPNLILLTNGGSPDSAYMISQNPFFPNFSDPINLFSMPVCSVIDCDNDSIPELIASPSDPSLIKSQDMKSVWKYDYSDISHQFELTNTSFIQEEMIDVGSGSVPVLYDWNGDGLEDLFIGNYGSYDSSNYINGFLNSYYSSSISYYQNIGTPTLPRFKLVTNDFGNIKQYGFLSLHPSFGDFNGDSIPDLLCGKKEGDLVLFLNNSISEMPLFAPPLLSDQSIDVGDFSTPQYFDLDRDGKKDLLIGNRRGHISFFRNVSSTEIPQFQLITDTLGGVDIRNYEISYFGYSIPCFFRNSSDETVLFCGSEQGNIFYYKNIDGNLEGNFTLELEALYEISQNHRYNIDEGIRTSPCVGDVDNDSFPELLIGNWAGGISYFKGIAVPDSTEKISNHYDKAKIEIFPNPTTDKITIKIHPFQLRTNGHLELFDLSGRIVKKLEIIGECATVDLSDLREGIYLGKFILDKTILEFKVIKIN